MDPGPLGDGQVWRPRLVAYTPLGPCLGDLPDPSSWTAVLRADPIPTLDIYYSLDTPQADLIQDGCEIAIEYPDYGNLTDVKPAWTESHLCRFMFISKSRDRLDGTLMWHYVYLGIGYELQRAWIQAADAVDPAEGDQRPTRSFPAPGSAAIPYPGRVMGTLWDEVVAATGWGQSTPGENMSRYVYGSVVDSNGVAWDADDALAVELGLDEYLNSPLAKFLDANKVDSVWYKRRHELYKFGTWGRDLTTGNAPIEILDGDSVTRAPQEVDSDPVATDVRIIGDKGKVWDFNNPDAETPRGTPEMVIETHEDVTTDAQAEAWRDAIFARAKVHDQQTVEQRFDTAFVRPLEHYRVGDRIKLPRGRNQDDEQRVTSVNVVVQEIAITVDSNGVHGHVIGGDRIRQAGERVAGVLSRMTKGSKVGPGGQKRDPGDDPRAPDISAFTAPTFTLTTVVDHNNRPRGQIEVTQVWDSTTAALEVDGTASPDEILVKKWIYEYRRSGRKWKDGLTVVADDTSNIAKIEQLFDPADTIQIRRYAVSHKDVESAPQTLTSATWTEDFDASSGADLIVDGSHINAAIRAARATDAGAGFAYELVSGEYVGAYSSTTPVHDYGIGGTAKGARSRVKPGDEVTVSIEALRAASTTAATLLAQIRWFNNDGTTLSTVTSISQAVTSSYVKYTGTPLVAPAGAATFSLRVKASALTGVKMRVRNVVADRRTVADRMADDSVLGRTVHATDNLAAKHTSTGAFIRAASGSGFQASPTGFYFVVGGTNVVSFDGSGIYVKGVLETSSGAKFGGAGLQDIQFPTAGYSIGEAGGFLEINSAGSGTKLNSAVIVTGALTVSGSTLFNGTRVTNNGGADVNASGTTLGFFGATAHTKTAVSAIPMVTLANVITVVTSIRQTMNDYGFG